ncbi:copper homeostasis periplasmic binding protein CopC [Rhizorhapis sp. SPR117]|uniref:copper homeostasis periplasmic binding protein CopC n=1 Tax=Rhizorhapis sp. SPR117 TaxID=2912611 RepID=UPI001EFFE287|nr:copper homeostasis periplasmic binding protein CopC [Rhizorhapis sp. SPR117]
MNRLFLLLVAPILALIAAPTAALAHPKLVSSTPAADATVAKPKAIKLTFSETLVPQFSGFELVMTGMPGMASHDPMKIAGFKTSVASDGKTMVATLPRPLPAGQYELSWHAVAADTHRIEGKFSFTVK